MSAVGPRRRRGSQPAPSITAITVEGYKSLSEEVTVELGPLTVLAGANSSGKSSVVQPLLLLKQTLEASYDPGPLRIDGPNVEFTAVDQFFSRTGRHKASVCKRNDGWRSGRGRLHLDHLYSRYPGPALGRVVHERLVGRHSVRASAGDGQ